MRRVIVGAAMLATLLALAIGGGSLAAGRAPRATSSHPCGTLGRVPHYQHVIWVFMENHSFGKIIRSSQAPYINRLARACGLAINYHNISHLSLTNYIAATSAVPLKSLRPFSGDCDPAPGCNTSTASIFGQLGSWKAYEDSMPSNCSRANSGNYAVRHNPPTYYTTLSGCAQKDVPYTQLAHDLAHGTLPAFSFITPNLIHDMHNGTVADGDTWLSRNLPTIFNSTEYKRGSVVLFLTWDEGEGGTSDNCATNTTDVGCHVAMVVVSPSTRPGSRSATLFNHYSLLATTERLLGLPLLHKAAAANTMLAAFKL